jgi:hypothetical protein
MKKILLVPAGLMLALAFQSCQNNAADDGTAQQRIDSTVNMRLVTLRDSMMMECNRMVASAAQAKADSTMAAMANTGKGGKKPTGTSSTKPTTTNDTKPTGPVGTKGGDKDSNPVGTKGQGNTTNPVGTKGNPK